MRAATPDLPIPSDFPPDSDGRIPFQTSVLLAADDGFVLGVSTWVDDGDIFVATDERLPPETPVDVSFVSPAGEKTLRARGHVLYWEEAANAPDRQRSGLGISIDAIDRVA